MEIFLCDCFSNAQLKVRSVPMSEPAVICAYLWLPVLRQDTAVSGDEKTHKKKDGLSKQTG